MHHSKGKVGHLGRHCQRPPWAARPTYHTCSHHTNGWHAELQTKAQAIKIRLAGTSDFEGIASVCATAFGTGRFVGLNSPELAQLEDRYAAAIGRDVKDKLQSSFAKKAQAALQHREHKVQRRVQLMRAQIAMLEGKRAVFPTQPSPQERREEARWRQARQYVVVVAEDDLTGQMVGTVTLCMMQPEALLPAPFPSTAPFRAYISNMAVQDGWRRRGLAKAMLQKCLRIAQLWGHDSVWLHVHCTNPGALRLYQRMGFSPAPKTGPLPTFLALRGEVLLRQQLAASKLKARGQDMERQQQLQQALDQAVESALGGGGQ